MSTQTVSLFLNPVAGRGRARKRLPEIEHAFRAAGIDVDLHLSRAVGDLETRVTEQVRAGIINIVVAGGDGSVHEAVNGIMNAGATARLGIVPVGTGNDFAKACAIPLDWELAVDALVARLENTQPLRVIDVGRMNGRYFANGVGIGFDAKVTQLARSYRWPIGDMVYLLAIFRCMLDGIATPELKIVAGDLSWKGPATLAAITNGPWVGGMFHIAPMAANDDGFLDLLIADPVSRLRICALLPKLMRGEHVDQAEITHATVTSLSLDASAPVPSHLDGEVQALTTRFEIELLPKALEII